MKLITKLYTTDNMYDVKQYSFSKFATFPKLLFRVERQATVYGRTKFSTVSRKNAVDNFTVLKTNHGEGHSTISVAGDKLPEVNPTE